MLVPAGLAVSQSLPKQPLHISGLEWQRQMVTLVLCWAWQDRAEAQREYQPDPITS